MLNINELLKSDNFEIIEKITILKEKQNNLLKIKNNNQNKKDKIFKLNISKLEKEITNLILEINFLNKIENIQKYTIDQIFNVYELFKNNNDNSFVFCLTNDEKEIYNIILKLNDSELIFLEKWICKNKNLNNNE